MNMDGPTKHSTTHSLNRATDAGIRRFLTLPASWDRVLARRSWRVAWVVLAGFQSLMGAAGCSAPQPKPQPVYFPAPPSQPRVVHLKSFNSVDELVKPRGGWLDAFLGGYHGVGVGTPGGLAYWRDHLFICDTTVNAVHRWNLATGQSRTIGADGSLRKPVAVAVDDAGTTYVADSARGEVVVFDADRRLLRTIRAPGVEAYRPVAVAVSADALFVADLEHHRIDKFNLAGEYVASFGGPGTEKGKLYYPCGVGVDPKGYVVVSDTFNARLHYFELGSLHGIGAYGSAGDRIGDFGKPRQLAVAPDGAAFIADAEFARIQVWNSLHGCLMLFGGSDDAPGHTPLPVGVAIAESVPDSIETFVPPDFAPEYYVFVSNTVGTHRLSVFAVGRRATP
jgi:hypothetical protein